MTNPLSFIHEGMSVVDRNGKSIGSVDWVKMTDQNPDTARTEQLHADAADRDPTLIDIVAEAFRVDEIPDPLKTRLMREGFVRMDADGLLASDRYILPDQIAIVTGNRVILDVEKQDLVKRH